MMNLFSQDLNHSITALKHYIIEEEQRLIDTNAGGREWSALEPFKVSLQNLQYMSSIYGDYNEKY